MRQTSVGMQAGGRVDGGRGRRSCRDVRDSSALRGGWFVVIVMVGFSAVLGQAAGSNASATALMTSANPKEVPSIAAANVDSEVFMKVHATAKQLAAVRRTIERSTVVAQFSFLDQAAAYREFQDIFAAYPDLIHSIRAADLPVSFRIVFRAKGDALLFDGRVGRMTGVGDIDSPAARELRNECEPGSADVEIYLKVNTPPATIDAVGAALRADSDVASVVAVSTSQAASIFHCMTAGDASAASIRARDLPASFRVTLQPQRPRAPFDHRWRNHADIDTVNDMGARRGDGCFSPGVTARDQHGATVYCDPSDKIWTSI